MEPTVRPGRSLFERHTFNIESPLTPIGVNMNIFYIIGVVVVVIFIAGYLGVHI